jgi:hypothetical protein
MAVHRLTIKGAAQGNRGVAGEWAQGNDKSRVWCADDVLAARHCREDQS